MIENTIKYSINTDAFSGPFDTLLELVKKHKLDLFDLDLQKLTDHYLAFIDENVMHMNLEEASDYMLIATKLLAMKAKYINEQYVDVGNDIDKISDDDIVKRLITYKLYKDVVPMLNQKYFERQLKCEKEKGNFNAFYEKPLSEFKLKSNYDITKLAESYTRLLQLFQHERLSKDFNIKVKELSQTEIQNDLVEFIHNLNKDVFSLLEYFYMIDIDKQNIDYFCGLFVAILYQIKVGSIEFVLIRDNIDITFKLLDKSKAVKIEMNS